LTHSDKRKERSQGLAQRTPNTKSYFYNQFREVGDSMFKKSGFIVSCIALLAIFLMIYCSDVFAYGQEDIKAAATKYYSGEAGTKVHNIKISGNWCVVFINCTGKSGDVWKGQVLLKKTNGKWKGIRGTSRFMTTTALKASGVPSKHWRNLLDPFRIEEMAPIVAVLEKSSSGKIHTNLRVASNWAFGAWEMPDASGEIEAEGVTLLTRTNGNWKIVTSGGGAMSDGELKQYGVPDKYLNELLDRK
jgi:hypothetical protein